MTDKSVLSVKNVTKKFGNVSALNGMSFSVDLGERIALIGPSGSGKSTLMNILTRTVTASEGQVEIDSKLIEAYQDSKEYAKKIGILRQQFDLIRNLSVVNNVLVGRFNEWGFWKSFISLFSPRDIETASQALTKVGLLDKMYQSTATLSGGEQQRVAIARLLVQNPKILLADEPVSSLDPANARNILKLLNDLAKEESRTLIASMHSVDLSLEYFSRIIGIRGGQIIFDRSAALINSTMLEELYEVKKNA